MCPIEKWTKEINWPLVISCFQGLLTPVIAGIVAYIAYQQSRTNVHKLKLDLFEKRFATFKTIRDTVGSIVSNGRIEPEPLFKFWIKSSDARFLFGKKIGMLVKEVYDRAIKLQQAIQMSGTVIEPGPEREKVVEEMGAQLKWFRKLAEGIADKFEKYLDVSKL